MTLSTTTSRIEYTGNGSTTAFSFPYYFLADGDLKVYQAGTLKTITTHYTVSGAGVLAGGTVTFLTAPASGEAVVIFRDPALTQSSDYAENDPFPAESHEEALDRNMMVSQRLKDRVDRSLQLSDFDTSGADTTLPAPVASTSWRWNSSADGIENYSPTTTPAEGGVTHTRRLEYTDGGSGVGLSGTDLDTFFGVSLVAGDIIQSDHFDSAKTPGSGALFQFTGTTTLAKAGNCPDADGYFYDAVGKQFEPVGSALNVLWYGAKADWNGSSGTDDAAAFVIAINANKPVYVPAGSYRIATRLDSTTTERIRMFGVNSCYKDTLEDEDGLSKIICDSIPCIGNYDYANQKLDPAKQKIAVIEKICFVANGTVSAAIVTTLNGGGVWDCHFKDFAYHGFIDCGSVQCRIGPNSYEDCGHTIAASGSVDSDTFYDGCAVLAVGSVPTVANNNVAATRALNSATFGSSKTIDMNVFQSSSQSTSFKGAIISNHRSTRLIIRSYQGVWVGNSQVEMPSPHLEVYATGGISAADGEPYALATWNATVYLVDDFLTTSPANTKNGVILQNRAAFTLATDFYGIVRMKGNESIFSRAHLESIKLGEYSPSDDSDSYQDLFPVTLGTATNPVLQWDPTTKCMVGSEGVARYPAQISLPIVESGTVAGSGGTLDFTSATIVPDDNLNGQGGRGVYDIDVEIVDTNNGYVYYHGRWVGIRQAAANNYEVRFYKLGSVDNNPPSGGFTVTENGSGPYTLRVTNNTGFTYRATAKSRRTGLTQTYLF